MFVIYDVVGAAASPEDVNSTEAQGNTPVSGPSLAPAKQPGIIFAAANDGTGPVTTIQAGGIFDNTRYTGETDQGQLNNGDAWQHVFYTSAAQTTLSWTMANSGSYMQASAIAFDAAAVSAKPAPPTNLKVTSVQ